MRRIPLRVPLAFLLSGAVIAVLVAQLDGEQALDRLRGAEPLWLAAAALCSCGVLLARACRYAALNRHARLPLTTAATAVQNFLNRVTPLRLGELSLPWILRRHAGEDAARSLVSVVLVRLVDLAVVAGAVALAVALRRGGGGAPALLPTLASAAALAALLVSFRAWMRGLLALGAWGARRSGLDRYPAVLRVVGKLQAAVADGASLSRGQTATVAATSLAVFALQTLMFGAILAAFGIGLDPVALAQGSAVAQAGAGVPVAAVGAFGPLEASWVAGFAWVGVPVQDAIVTALACQVVTLAFAAAFALPAWLWLARQPRLDLAATP